MTPAQRRAHLAAWLVLAPALLAAIIALALLAPDPIAQPTGAPAQGATP